MNGAVTLSKTPRRTTRSSPVALQGAGFTITVLWMAAVSLAGPTLGAQQAPIGGEMAPQRAVREPKSAPMTPGSLANS
jgi:hypothetical protein